MPDDESEGEQADKEEGELQNGSPRAVWLLQKMTDVGNDSLNHRRDFLE